MPKIIYLIDPNTKELLGEATCPLDPVASEQADELVYAEVNTENATEQKPPRHDREADDVLWDNDGWKVIKGAKAKREQALVEAEQTATDLAEAAELTNQLAAMTESERKLYFFRQEDPEAFDAFETAKGLEAREKQASERLADHKKNRADNQKTKPNKTQK